ncbi:MAG: hypothetical protein KF809_08290 [Chloroflexi bacterium]|nr:hypothetical protein [Chloroflexota bacterium]
MTSPPVALRRIPLLLPAAIALVAGLAGGLALLGLPAHAGTLRFAGSHGVLMTLGFLGTLISLERAVALARPWGFGAPIAAGLGGLLLVAGAPPTLAAGVFAVGGGVLVVMYVAFDRIERSIHGTVQALGAVAWLLGAILLVAGRPLVEVTPLLAAFLVLTIVGERLELSRLARPSQEVVRVFAVLVALLCLGVLVAVHLPEVGIRVAGVAMLGLAAWLARYDIARRTVRIPGVTRFIAVCLLVGYVWLAVAGGLWLILGPVTSGSGHDAMLHALFLGFVMSMVFGHAPVILPSVLRVPLPYRPWFYVHLGVLHVGLLLRVVAGDLLGNQAAWQWGGVLGVVAIALFLVASVVSSVMAIRARR